MFWWIAIGLTVVLLIAPLRRRFIQAWFFTIPALGGLILALVLLDVMKSLNPSLGLPAWGVLLVVVMVTLEAGFAGMACILDVLGSSRNQKP